MAIVFSVLHFLFFIFAYNSVDRIVIKEYILVVVYQRHLCPSVIPMTMIVINPERYPSILFFL